MCPRVNDVNVGINIDENIKRIFKASINKFYNNQKKNSLVTTYHLMLKEYFSEKVMNEKGKTELILKEKEYIPSLAQYRHWVNKGRNIKKEVLDRNGSRNFYQNHRAVLNSVNDLVIGTSMEYLIINIIG